MILMMKDLPQVEAEITNTAQVGYLSAITVESRNLRCVFDYGNDLM
jgi:hypothetical protein